MAFPTTAGGFEHQFLRGYTGLRWMGEGLTQKFGAVLPSHLRNLKIRNMTIRGRKYDLIIEGGALTRIPK